MQISKFNWRGTFINLNVNKQVNFFNSTFSDFTPNTIVTCNDQDPPWLGEKSKLKLN